MSLQAGGLLEYWMEKHTTKTTRLLTIAEPLTLEDLTLVFLTIFGLGLGAAAIVWVFEMIVHACARGTVPKREGDDVISSSFVPDAEACCAPGYESTPVHSNNVFISKVKNIKLYMLRKLVEREVQ
jgi:hypothetical protein